MVGEEEEGRGGGELVAHEDQRRGGREQQQCNRGLVLLEVDQLAQPLSQRSIANLVVVLKAVDERFR